jgi:hypothetical protein
VPEYPRIRTRARGTRDGHEYETDMIRFKKNPFIRSRRIRLPAVLLSTLPATRRGCTQPVPTVTAGKTLQHYITH